MHAGQSRVGLSSKAYLPLPKCMDFEMLSLILDTCTDSFCVDADKEGPAGWELAASIARFCHLAHAAAIAWQAAQTHVILDGRRAEGNICKSAFVALARNCTRCESLELRGITYTSLSAGLASLAFPLLRKLAVVSCPAPTPYDETQQSTRHDDVMEALLAMMKLCPLARELELGNLTQRPPPVAYTEFDAYRDHVNLSHVSAIGRIARVCHQLESVDVDHSSLNRHDIRAIADCCPNFRSLQASSTPRGGLHDGTFLDLSRLGSLSELFLGFDVSWTGADFDPDDPDELPTPCAIAFDDQFDRFTRSTPLLTHFCLNCDEFKCSPYINDANMCSLARGCPGLVFFEVPECGVTDEGVMTLVSGCPRLTHLNIGSNSYPTYSGAGSDITDASIHAIARGLPALTDLNVRGCCKVTKEAIIHLQAALPNVVVELPWSEIDMDSDVDSDDVGS